MGMPIKNPDTFAVGKCFLYKSPVCIYNIRPTAIYYGTDIAPINRKMLHIIAKEKSIKEYQMYIDNKSYLYSMRYREV